jgi:hypothetical protein
MRAMHVQRHDDVDDFNDIVHVDRAILRIITNLHLN